MKIVYLITGSGGSFYCGNCYRDMIYLKAIRKVAGMHASAIPLYLPPDDNTSSSEIDQTVFFGAISMYLRGKVPFLKNMPGFIDRIVDSGPMLRMAAKRAGTTRTDGLEEMTLGMIDGKDAFPEKELDRLVSYLTENGKPDIIHLSNALIIGLSRHLKKRLNVKIVCSLLNEDDWIDEMAEPYQSEAWRLAAQEAPNVDAFVTPSNYYKEKFMSKTGIKDGKFFVVPLGIEAGELLTVKPEAVWPSIGYFCRVNEQNGFHKIVDAFIQLKKEERYSYLTLHVSGGYTADDKPFLTQQISKIRENGYSDSVKIYPGFQGLNKLRFFSKIDVLSVPVKKYDGYGLYLLEGNAAGVPVVQPHTGAFPEIIATTGGGITYAPDDEEHLREALSKMLDDTVLSKETGIRGRKMVTEKLTLEKMSEELEKVYRSV